MKYRIVAGVYYFIMYHNQNTSVIDASPFWVFRFMTSRPFCFLFIKVANIAHYNFIIWHVLKSQHLNTLDCCCDSNSAAKLYRYQNVCTANFPNKMRKVHISFSPPANIKQDLFMHTLSHYNIVTWKSHSCDSAFDATPFKSNWSLVKFEQST